MAAFILWCLLLVVCWPLALLHWVLYPLIWLLLCCHSGLWECGGRSV